LLRKTTHSPLASAETWTYGYDLRGQLLWAKDQATDGGTLLSLSTYVYDVFGNRIETDVWTQSSGVVTTRRFGYDGANAVLELDGSNNLVMRRLFLDGPNRLLARIDNTGTAAWYLTDDQGSVRKIVNLAGTSVLDAVTYDAFGNVKSESSAAQGDAYKFQGGRFDGVTGLILFGRRYYNPGSGTWLQRDPIGFAGGQTNLYSFVGNSPTNSADPSGLARVNFHIFSQLKGPLGIGADFGWVTGPGGAVTPHLSVGVGWGTGFSLPNFQPLPFHGNVTFDPTATPPPGFGVFTDARTRRMDLRSCSRMDLRSCSR
jgi:RHS repeat-associated protein